MASEVDICNQAIRLLGGERISSLSNNTNAGKLCFDLYAQTRDELIHDHRWNFATIRAALVENGTGPAVTVDGLDKRFDLPADFIRLWEIDLDMASGGGGLWRLEDGFVVTGESTVNIVYSRQVTVPGDFSVGFIRTLALRLAAKFAVPLLRDTQLMVAFQEMADNSAAAASTAESMQNDVDDLSHGILTTVRLAGSQAPSNVTVP